MDKFTVPNLLLTTVLVFSILGSLFVAGVVVVVQISVEIKNNAKLRRLKYVTSGERVECISLSDSESFHLFLSHAWPTAQDRMRIVKQRLSEVLPSCRVFLDVEELFFGSTINVIEKSSCILVRAQTHGTARRCNGHSSYS
jgi:hypothetical protein